MQRSPGGVRSFIVVPVSSAAEVVRGNVGSTINYEKKVLCSLALRFKC